MCFFFWRNVPKNLLETYFLTLGVAGNTNMNIQIIKFSRHLRSIYEVTMWGHDAVHRRLLDGAIAIPEKIHGASARVLPLLFVGPQVSCVALESPWIRKNILLYHVISSINHSYPNISKLYHHEVLSELFALSFFWGAHLGFSLSSHGIHPSGPPRLIRVLLSIPSTCRSQTIKLPKIGQTMTNPCIYPLVI